MRLPSAHGHRKSCIIHKEQHQLKLAQTVSVNMMLPSNGPPPTFSDGVPILRMGEGHDFFQSAQRAAALSTAYLRRVQTNMCRGLWSCLNSPLPASPPS